MVIYEEQFTGTQKATASVKSNHITLGTYARRQAAAGKAAPAVVGTDELGTTDAPRGTMLSS